MRLAAGRGAEQKLHGRTPVGPRIKQLDRSEIAIADEKVFRALGGAVRQVQRELLQRHEALIRERVVRSLTGLAGRCGIGGGAGS